MKAIDLRIGNYMHDREGRLCKVERIDMDEFYAPAIIGPVTSCPNKPIPLTEDWLVKFGFEKKFNIYRFKDNEYFSIDLPVNGFYSLKFDGDYTAVEFQYVHQLQNLYYALTTTELTPTQ